MAAPIIVHGAVAGFLGVDNPRRYTADLLLLYIVASTCYNEMTSERMMERRISTTNKALVDRTKIIHSLGEIYSSLYDIDLKTGQFCELTSMEDIHKLIGDSGDAQIRLHFFLRKHDGSGVQGGNAGFCEAGYLESAYGSDQADLQTVSEYHFFGAQPPGENNLAGMLLH